MITITSSFHQPLKVKTYGNSMYPLLQEEDVITLRKKSFKHLKTDDIISFRKGRNYITHRIIYKTPTYIITKGDNNPYSDGKIYPSHILGVVEEIKRNKHSFSPEDYYLFQSTIYFQEIIKIHDLFTRHYISYVFLKGLPLYLLYQKTHPRRIYADCDILINKKDIAIITNLFKTLGYEMYDDPFPKTLGIKNKKMKEISFYKEINNQKIIFDVHLEPVFMMIQLEKLDSLYPQSLVKNMTHDFLQKKQFKTLNDVKLPFLSPVHQIVYLSLHFFHDNYKGGYKLELLSTVCNSYRNKKKMWDEVITYIKSYQLENFTYYSFYLLKKYYLPTLPNDFLKKLHLSKKKILLIKRNYKNHNIFDSETRFNNGIKRFKNLFYLSPFPLWKKIGVFFNREVLALIYVKMKQL